MIYTGSHIRPDICGYLFGNSLFHQSWRNRLHNSAAAVFDPGYQMWLVIISAIDNRTHSVDLLDHRQCISLSKCGTCKFCLSHGLAGVDYTAALIRKVNTGSCSEIESTLRFKEIVFSHFRRNLHHTIIAGIGNNIGKCFCSMGIGPYRTFNKCRSSFRTKGLSAVADKIIRLGNRSHLKGRTHNNRLYY